MKKNLLFTTILSLIVFAGYAQTTVYPTDDMTTNTGGSGMSPTNEQIWLANWSAMQNYHQSMLKFDLSAYVGETLNSATLHLNQYFHAPDGTPTPAKIYLVSEDWNENSWPANTNVSHDDTPFATVEFTTTLGWYSIDVTSLINEMIQAGANQYGLVIIADSGTKFAQFYSKDASDEANHPYLELDFAQSIETEAISALSIYPNPVKENSNITFSLATNEEVHIYISDMLGKTVCEIMHNDMTAGLHNIPFNTSDLPEGIYFACIVGETQKSISKVIVK